MASFNVEYVGDSPSDIQNRLSALGNAVGQRTNAALMETAQEVKEDLQDTSPVDTGEYQESWYIQPVSNNEVWVLNGADHAKFVMLPNRQMIGVANADFPSQGILHAVKSRAKQHSDSYRGNMVEQLKDMVQNFKIR